MSRNKKITISPNGYFKDLSLFYFSGLKTFGANVGSGDLAVILANMYLLDVRLE